MNDYQYVAWFRDAMFPDGDVDAEWCACFVIIADDQDSALRYGDELARDFAERRDNETFLYSYIDVYVAWGKGGPTVRVGDRNADSIIGW